MFVDHSCMCQCAYVPSLLLKSLLSIVSGKYLLDNAILSWFEKI